MMKFNLKSGFVRLGSAVFLGVLAGTSLYTFFYARGFSYFLDDPDACRNCHVMESQYDGWVRSSHHAVTTCNSCHTPRPLAAKYAVKGLNGWNHSVAFTTGRFKEPIRIKSFNAEIVRKKCVKCHQGVISRMVVKTGLKDAVPDCVRCHGNVGHSNRY